MRLADRVRRRGGAVILVMTSGNLSTRPWDSPTAARVSPAWVLAAIAVAPRRITRSVPVGATVVAGGTTTRTRCEPGDCQLDLHPGTPPSRVSRATPLRSDQQNHY
jgi:hypothetical protein